jgi:hypothetical protein
VNARAAGLPLVKSLRTVFPMTAVIATSATVSPARLAAMIARALGAPGN